MPSVTEAVALLRGINVGGSRKVPMAGLRTLFTEAGCEGVTTYIQSGNVVFSHPAYRPAELAADLEARIRAATGFEVPVVLRTRRDWAGVVGGNPYPEVEPTKLLVVFLKGAPAPAGLDALARAAGPSEAFVHRDRELYLHLPDGVGRSKLPQALGPLRTPATGRNWRTVLTLGELMADVATR